MFFLLNWSRLLNFSLKSGNYWLSSGLELLALSLSAVSSIFKHSKSRKLSKIKILDFFLQNQPHFAYLRHPHRWLVVVKWLKAISTIIICNINHIQPAKVEKIDKVIIFENWRKMTKSGTQGPIGRAKFSNFDFDHFFSRIEPFWVILSKKNFFEKFVEND